MTLSARNVSTEQSSANDNGSPWKERADAERAAEAARCMELKRALLVRKATGFRWSVPANDNQAWPLAQQLRKDGNEPLLGVAERYRTLFDSAHTSAPLIGTEQGNDFMPLVQKVWDRPDGSTANKGVLTLKHHVVDVRGETPGADIVVARREPTTFLRRPAKPAAKRWNGDNLIIAVIDSKRDLVRLRTALGPLAKTFEEAVVHGATLTDIGRGRGSKPAPQVGRWCISAWK
jgi:hypothetical protein